MANKPRRAFSPAQVDTWHEGALGSLLLHALDIPKLQASAQYNPTDYAPIHRIHPYPTRFHPHLPRTILREITSSEKRVLDPFMGSGTTLVETMLANHQAFGGDLNPISELIVRESTRIRSAEQAEQFIAATEQIAQQVADFHGEKNPPRLKHPRLKQLGEYYQPHLFAELTQWRRLIELQEHKAIKNSLRMLFSTIVLKFSNFESETSANRVKPQFSKGAISRLLVKIAYNLAEAQHHLYQHCAETLRPFYYTCDINDLSAKLPQPADIIITSPPTPIVYRNHHHHLLRQTWLCSNHLTQTFSQEELGQPHDNQLRLGWQKELNKMLRQMKQMLSEDGYVFLVISDWITNKQKVSALHAIEKLLPRLEWELQSFASVRRRVYSETEQMSFGETGKWEHLLCLTQNKPAFYR